MQNYFWDKLDSLDVCALEHGLAMKAVLFWLLLLLPTVLASRGDQEKIEILVKQLTPGTRIISFFAEKNVMSPTVEMLRLRATRSLPVMSLSSLSRQYRRTRFLQIPNFHNKSREQKGLMNYASGSAILIYAFAPKRSLSTPRILVTIYQTLAFPTSTPRVLLIPVVDKRRSSYKSVFAFLLKQGIIDVEILEVSPKQNASRRVAKVSKKRKTPPRSIAECQHDFRVHKCNPFSKVCKIEKLSSKSKWFDEPKDRNLHGYKVQSASGYYYESRNPLNRKKNISVDVGGKNSIFGKYLKTSCNFTYTTREGVSPLILHLPLHWMQPPYSPDGVYLRPLHLDLYQIYTPIIYDEQINVDLGQFVPYLVGTIAILLLLDFCRFIGSFSQQTWSHWAIFKMLLALSNEHGPRYFAETILFCIISISGLFFSSEFSNSVTDILVPVKLEREFYTFEDLAKSNITVWLADPPNKPNTEFYIDTSDEHPILTAKVRHECFKLHTTWYSNRSMIFGLVNKMLQSSDMAMTIHSGRRNPDIHGGTIYVDLQVPKARRSDMREYMYHYVYHTTPYFPLFERFSDLVWRFEEKGLDNFRAYKHVYVSDVRRDISKSFFQKNPEFYDEEEADEINVAVLVFVFMCGNILALVALKIEILLFVLTDY